MKAGPEMLIRRRIQWVLLFFLIATVILLVRLFTMQILHYEQYRDLALRQQKLIKKILPERGLIYAQRKDGSLIPLVLNRTEKILTASPKIVKDTERSITILSQSLDLSSDELRDKLSRKDDLYEIIAKRLDPQKAEELIKILPVGFFLEDEQRRVYPHGTFACHLIGFVSKEADSDKGRYGLERFYENVLSGESGIFEGIKSATGFWVALGKRIINPPKNGSSLVLTLNYDIQLKAEEILSRVSDKWAAVQGHLLVIDPKSGKVLALVSRPAFDPNEFSKEKKYSVFLNPTVEGIYELGSVMKPIVMAGGLEEKLITPQSTYEDTGEVRIGGYTIRNFDGRAYKIQTMTQVLEKSLNTGAVYVSRLLGKDRHLEYIKRFGFGDKTGIDLPGENAGNISNLESRRDIDFATASFGQGIAISPIQMAMAIAAIANEGKLMRPYVVEKIIDDSGSETKIEPKTVRQVISKETAENLTKMLVSAVRNGFENKAGVKGYFVAGKTGTAQIPRKDGRGYSDKVIHTFIGYAPAFNPRFLIYLQLNEPKGNRFAANTLTPAFHDLAEYILNYYEVPPDEK